MGVILDQHGRVIERDDIKRREGIVRSFPERVDWQHNVAVGIDPQRMATILRQADSGDQRELLSLAVEMEERDAEYFSKVQTRISAVVHVPIRAEARDLKNKRAVEIADACQELVIDTAAFRWFLQDLMDAITKGYSVVQPIWNTSTRPWVFSSFEHHDPRCFQFSEDRKTLRVRDNVRENGRAMPFDCLVHFPRIRTGVKLRGGLARLAAVNWLFKTCTVTDMLAFAEVYGMPIRLGRYNPATATEDEIATLHHALVNLGHDAAAMIPTGMTIEFPDARRPTSGDNIYKSLIEYFDGQTAKAILGQVLALDARATGLGQAVADLHAAVRQDIKESDALALRATVEPLLKLWVELNFGAGAPVPRLLIDIRPPLDTAKFTTAVLPWLQHAGLEVPKKWLFDALQIPEPDDGEETVKAPLAPGTPGSGAPVPGLKSS